MNVTQDNEIQSRITSLEARIAVLENRDSEKSKGLESQRTAVRRFVAERCDLGPDKECVTSDLLEVFRNWANRNGENSTVAPTHFGRLLRIFIPDLETKQARVDGKMARIFKGVGY